MKQGMFYFAMCIKVPSSGGSRGGAWGAAPPPPSFWVKKEEMTEGKKASRERKSRPGPPLVQGLDPLLPRPGV